MPPHANFKGHRSLVRGRDLHGCRLADDCRRRRREAFSHLLDHARRTDAADFFIVGESDLHRSAQRSRSHRRRRCEDRCEEALHVASAAAVEASAPFRQRPRTGLPILAIDGYDVSVPRENHAARYGRPDHCKEICLAPIRIENARRIDSVPCQILIDPFDQVQVRFARHRFKRNKPFQYCACGN